eukprot:SAG22_NODE_10212_length_547_cov_1.292411_1_plen_154_part_01
MVHLPKEEEKTDRLRVQIDRTQAELNGLKDEWPEVHRHVLALDALEAKLYTAETDVRQAAKAAPQYADKSPELQASAKQALAKYKKRAAALLAERDGVLATLQSSLDQSGAVSKATRARPSHCLPVCSFSSCLPLRVHCPHIGPPLVACRLPAR